MALFREFCQILSACFLFVQFKQRIVSKEFLTSFGNFAKIWQFLTWSDLDFMDIFARKFSLFGRFKPRIKLANLSRMTILLYKYEK